MRTLLLTTIALLLTAAPAHAEEGGAPTDARQAAVDAILPVTPGCAEAIETCVGLDLFIALDAEGAPVVDAAWLTNQLERASEHYAPLSIGFEVTGVTALEDDELEITSRSQRNRLGRDRFALGTLQIYVVQRLANVDEPGDIYGVHWRDRADMSRTWVILSSRSWAHTLAHEIGHFFELPHSSYAISIMNKTPRDAPPHDERTFHAEELEDIRDELRRKLRDGRITPR